MFSVYSGRRSIATTQISRIPKDASHRELRDDYFVHKPDSKRGAASQPAIGASSSEPGCDATVGTGPFSTRVAPTDCLVDQSLPMQKDYSAALEILKRVIADKEAWRLRNAALPWHEKVAISERVRDAGRVARASMARHMALLRERDMETQATSEVPGIEKKIEDA